MLDLGRGEKGDTASVRECLGRQIEGKRGKKRPSH